jgi:hypothetical protein
VLIQVGKEAVVNVTVDSAAAGPEGKPKGEVIEISGSAPIIDQGSTKTGVTLTDDYTRNIPTGRTFGAVLGSAAGSQNDLYGVSFAGATSAENTYIVEGINTTDTGFGGLSTNLPNEFISETEIITGGYNAEYGRATGGIVNVVTKQGSNTFHGSVFGYWKPGALVSQAQTIQREGGSIDFHQDLDFNYDVGAEIGGPIIKDKLWFHVGFNPNISHLTTTRLIQSQVDKNGDGVPDVDPNTGFTLHEPVAQSTSPQNYKTYYFTAKLNGAINQNNQFQISAFGNPRSYSDITGAFNLTAPDDGMLHVNDGAYDLSGKWTSKLNEGKTQVDAVLGFHRGYSDQGTYNSRQNVPQVFYNYERSLADFHDVETGGISQKCDDGNPNDPYPMIRNCPITGYTDQGLGFIENRTNDRTSAVVSVTQRVKALGYHTFKAGVDLELSTYDSARGYTGGELLRRNAPDTPTLQGRWQLRQLMKFVRNLTPEEIADPNFPANVMLASGQVLCANNRAICGPTDTLHADTNDTGVGAYIQDSWQVVPNFTINAGLRWEDQTGYVAKALQGQLTPDGEVIPETAYQLKNLLAPRLGFIYDPTQEGKSKIFGHYGRFYENVPMDLNVRSFGGEITNFSVLNAHRRAPGDPMYNPNCHVDHGDAPNLATLLNQCDDRLQQALLGEGIEFVSPGIQGEYTDEVILGAEYEVANDLKIGVNYIHRILPLVIEDVSTDGGNSYLITNPGENFDKQSADLHAQSQATLAQGGCMSLDDTSPNCDPSKLALATVYENRSKQLAYVKHYDKPSRNYDGVQLQATLRATKRSLLLASYTYSVEKGNYPGLFSTETGQLDPNITSLYDLPDLMANRYGFLGLDRPHNLKVDGFYQFDLVDFGALTAGGSFRAQSGIAHNALASHPTYGLGESYVLPRGAIERSPVTTQFDVHLAYGYRLNKTTMLEGFVNIFNLFNQQDELSVDEIYTFDNAEPIVGGDRTDLLHLKAHDDNGIEQKTTVTPNKNFDHVSQRQLPRNVQLGVRLTF